MDPVCPNCGKTFDLIARDSGLRLFCVSCGASLKHVGPVAGSEHPRATSGAATPGLQHQHGASNARNASPGTAARTGKVVFGLFEIAVGLGADLFFSVLLLGPDMIGIALLLVIGTLIFGFLASLLRGIPSYIMFAGLVFCGGLLPGLLTYKGAVSLLDGLGLARKSTPGARSAADYSSGTKKVLFVIGAVGALLLVAAVMVATVPPIISAVARGPQGREKPRSGGEAAGIASAEAKANRVSEPLCGATVCFWTADGTLDESGSSQILKRMRSIPAADASEWMARLAAASGSGIGAAECMRLLSSQMGILFKDDVFLGEVSRLMLKRLSSLSYADVRSWKTALESLLGHYLEAHSVASALLPVEVFFVDDRFDSGKSAVALGRLPSLKPADIASVQDLSGRIGLDFDAAIALAASDEFFPDGQFSRDELRKFLARKPSAR